jgi:hypothetical protein
VYYFLFYCIVPLYVNVWCVENDSFKEFPGGEDFEDFEQQQEFVEDKSLMHAHFSHYNMHFNYTVYYLFFCINMMGPI